MLNIINHTFEGVIFFNKTKISVNYENIDHLNRTVTLSIQKTKMKLLQPLIANKTTDIEYPSLQFCFN